MIRSTISSTPTAITFLPPSTQPSARKPSRSGPRSPAAELWPDGPGRVGASAFLGQGHQVDGALVADRRPTVRLVPEAPRDLLRRPAGLQALATWSRLKTAQPAARTIGRAA